MVPLGSRHCEGLPATIVATTSATVNIGTEARGMVRVVVGSVKTVLCSVLVGGQV
jgi:hypothetical protein